jgi:D-sedoheptulose 7-phosphate isomerase
MSEMCDINFIVPSSSTAMIQEIHTMLGHVICAFVEKEIMFNE